MRLITYTWVGSTSLHLPKNISYFKLSQIKALKINYTCVCCVHCCFVLHVHLSRDFTCEVRGWLYTLGWGALHPSDPVHGRNVYNADNVLHCGELQWCHFTVLAHCMGRRGFHTDTHAGENKMCHFSYRFCLRPQTGVWCGVFWVCFVLTISAWHCYRD